MKSSTSFRYRAKERVGRTLEAIEILKRAWTGERFDFEGKHFNFKNARVLPKPISPKGPELLWGGMNPESIKRSATLDLGFACNLGSGEIRKYHEALRKLGKDPAEYSVVNTRQVYVADSEDQAWDEIGPGLMYQMELYGKWLDEGGIDTAGRYRPDAGALRRSAILGPPRRVIEQLEALSSDSLPRSSPCCVKDDLGQQCGFRGSAPIVANLPDCVAEGVEFELSGDFVNRQ